MKKYFLQLISLLLFLTAAEILILGDRYFNWILGLGVPCFFLLLGGAAYFVMRKIADNKRFLTYFMALIFAKMMLCIIAVALYLIFIKTEKTIFAVCFFVDYVVFTIFETYIFLNINKSVNSGK